MSHLSTVLAKSTPEASSSLLLLIGIAGKKETGFLVGELKDGAVVIQAVVGGPAGDKTAGYVSA